MVPPLEVKSNIKISPRIPPIQSKWFLLRVHNRKLRLEFEGAIYYVTCRMLGDARNKLFIDAADRMRFLDSLEERLLYLQHYMWSSYAGYIDKSKRLAESLRNHLIPLRSNHAWSDTLFVRNSATMQSAAIVLQLLSVVSLS